MSSNQDSSGELADQLSTLRATDPRRYALLQRHCGALQDVLEQADRNYASAKQLHSNWDDPPFQPQITGQLLSIAATLDILQVHTHRSNRNRYDLTAYNQTRMAHLASLLEANCN